jgi:uncharacterized phiE125 gp8 family phage protein
VNYSPYLEPIQPPFITSLLGPLELVTAPSGALVSVTTAQDWLRVEHDTDQTQIAELVEDATEYCGELINGQRQLRQATFDLPVADWWSWKLELPRPPLVSVAWVKYRDTAGDLQTLATTYYEVRTPVKMPGRIEWITTSTLPELQSERAYPITIRFTAGYTTATLPAPIRRAIQFLVSAWYDERMPRKQDTSDTVSNLLLGSGWGSYG